MLVECYDEKGAEVYEMIIKQIFQDLVLGPSVDDLRAFANPDEAVFILAIKMRKTGKSIHLNEVATLEFDKELDKTNIIIDNENYLPNILSKLWSIFPRESIYQPDRNNIVLEGNQLELNDLIVDNSEVNLKKKVYDAAFRILPEGFRITKDLSKENIIVLVATDELIKDEWIEKANEFISELS
ncbi:methanogenesis marker 17 protein [Methanobrevibacter sp. DSM 116169]|uniref:methanogenesis marker 17 protein n=1 Tax=Methanobrevibacter sp. DSM 116169 TaxID=3242727 RepID=UPI0038FBEFFB